MEHSEKNEEEKNHNNEEHQEHETHHHKKKRSRRNKTIAIGVVGILLLIIGIGIAWLYTGSFSSAKEKVFSTIPLPAAIVDMKLVSGKMVIDRIDLAKQLSDAQGAGAEVPPADTFDQIIETKKIDALASKYKLSVPQEELETEYKNIIKQYANDDENAFKDELQKTYGMSPEQFKNEVIKQELLQSELLVWFNQQSSLNQSTYDKINGFKSKIDSGTSFDDVSKEYTSDEATKDFAGDSGVIPFDQLLPEFRKALAESKTGDVRIVASRYGLHMLKVLDVNNNGENGAKQIHLQQIYVKQEGFPEWLATETEKVRVVRLLKF